MVLAIQQTSIYFGTVDYIVSILKANISLFLLVLGSLLLFLLLLGGVLDPVLQGGLNIRCVKSFTKLIFGVCEYERKENFNYWRRQEISLGGNDVGVWGGAAENFFRSRLLP